MTEDVEKAVVTATYGATEFASIDSADKLPLFLGLWQVSPSQLYRVGLAVYIAWFVIFRLADIGYILTVDARFPPGLGHYYPSEEERLMSVAYTREVLICGMLHRCCVFAAVLILLLFGLFARFDAALRSLLSSVASWWEASRIRTWCNYAWSPFSRCRSCSCAPCVWCSKLKDRMLHGRLSEDLYNRIGFRLSCRELLFGSLYLTLIAAGFFLISAPFSYWASTIDLKFGFSNSLVVSPATIRKKIVSGLISMLLFGIPTKFVYLAVLQYRRGWLFMYVSLIILLIWAQYNIKVIAPYVLDMNNPFPNENFAVGRAFPWVHTDSKKSPWLSLNRIYFKDPSYGSTSQRFSTRDKSAGDLTLTQNSKGSWQISKQFSYADMTPPVYAETTFLQVGSDPISAVANHVLDDLRTKTWTVGGNDARIGVRSGSHLRDKLYEFAHKRKIGIAQIYMVDGSHKDIRANAFVAGAGNSSVVGLFDTLFLGQRNSDSDDDADSSIGLLSGDSVVQHTSELVQDVDTEQEELDRRPPRNSAPTEAMSDDEIVSILAHELGHAALKHLEQGMVVQSFTSFVTFATLGWMALSPLAGAALSLHAPLLHVGACAYEHVVGPPVEGIMKLFTDALTRHNEYEADAYAAQISEQYGNALQTSLAKLSINSNQDPDVPYFYELLHHDHPAFSRRWAHIEAVKKETYGKP